MASLIEVPCADCKTVHKKTLKQVNQRIKKVGVWRCVNCAIKLKRTNLEGMRFGRLQVVSFSRSRLSEKSGEYSLMWNCLCDCGNTNEVSTNALNSGNCKSCGCLKVELTSIRSMTHGKTLSKEYLVWQAMKTRCNNPNSVNYKDYGGRGIKICERWESNFENFLSDMGEVSKGMSIERIDVNGNYEPANCKWASRSEQSRNTRRNRILTFNGISKCLIDWAKDLGIDQASLRERLEKWSLEKSLTTTKKGK